MHLLGGLARVIYAGAEPLISDLARENYVRLYKEGDFECYGGDLLASNEELNLKHAGELGELMEMFESWKEQWRR